MLKQAGTALSLMPWIMLAAWPAFAGPKVAVTIAPIHSLVAMVMGDSGTPALIVRPGASPHDYAMKPSEARALDEADIVFWVGEALEPWMEKPLSTLAEGARTVELGTVDGLTRLSVREGGGFEEHRHEESPEHAHEEHAHEEHAREAQEEHHDEEGLDPHLWLDPENARLWLTVIARELGAADPAGAATYEANAAAATGVLDRLEQEIANRLTPVRDLPFVVFHDAYHYFDRRFDLAAVGSITLSDARAPGAARIQEIRAKIADTAALCVFSEPQFEPALVDTVIEGTPARKGVLDPIGADLPPGPGLYPALLRGLADDLLACLDRPPVK